MKRKLLIIIGVSVLICTACCLITFLLLDVLFEVRYIEKEIAPGIHAELYEAKNIETSQSPAVIILPGASGVFDDYSVFAQQLSEEGYTTLVVDYYDGGKNLFEPSLLFVTERNWNSWIRNVEEAYDYLTENKKVNSQCIVTIGYSRGASLAYYLARTRPIQASVIYYGVPTGKTFNNDAEIEEVLKAQPKYNLHLVGDADFFLSVEKVKSYQQRLIELSKNVELHVYEDAQHGFDIESVGNSFNQEARNSAREEVISFLDEYKSACR